MEKVQYRGAPLVLEDYVESTSQVDADNEITMKMGSHFM